MIIQCLFVMCFVATSKGETRLLLVTGCAHSGTTYTSRLLKVAGLAIEHERIGDDGMVSWMFNVDIDKGFLCNYSDNEGITFNHTFHMVRHPLSVISSWYTRYNETSTLWPYLRKYIFIPEEATRLALCAHYYLGWNLLIESMSEYTFQVETIDKAFPEISNRIGIPLDPKALVIMPPKMSENAKKRSRKITWNDLKAELSPEYFSDL